MSKQSNQSKQKNKEGTKLILCEVLGIIKQEQTCPENNKTTTRTPGLLHFNREGWFDETFSKPRHCRKEDWSDPCQDFWLI